jgi:hypothetical protein
MDIVDTCLRDGLVNDASRRCPSRGKRQSRLGRLNQSFEAGGTAHACQLEAYVLSQAGQLTVPSPEPSSVGRLNHTYLPCHPNSIRRDSRARSPTYVGFGGRTQDTGTPLKGKSNKYHDLTSYQGHSYLWTVNAIKLEDD